MKKTALITIGIVVLIGFLGIAFATFWSDDIRIDTDPGSNSSTNPKVASDSIGNVCVVWHDQRSGSSEVYFNRSNDYGRTFMQNDIVLSHPSSSFDSDLQVSCGESGHIYVLWVALQDSQKIIIFMKSEDLGETWHSQQLNVGPSSGWLGNIDFAHDQYGSICVIANGRESFPYGVYASCSNDYGITWLDYEQVNSNIGDEIQADATIACDEQGNFYAAWVDNRDGANGNRRTYFNRYNVVGQAWGADQRIEPVGFAKNSSLPEIECDNAGNVYVAWKVEDGQFLTTYYTFNHSLDSGDNWSGSQELATEIDHPQIEADENGNVYLIWNDATNKISFRSSFDYGVTWQPIIRLMHPEDVHNCQLGNYDVVANGKHIYVTWENLEPWQGIFFNYSLNGGLTWRNYLMRVDSNPGESVETNTPSIAVDVYDNVYVTWEDRRNDVDYGDIYFNYGDFWGLTTNEKIRFEADYLVACQFVSDPYHIAYGAINDVYTPDTPPDYVVPRENGMAILGLLKAYEALGDQTYLDRANLVMDYLVRVQESDGSWKDEYDYRNPEGGLDSKSPTQPAEVMIAMNKLGYRADRYGSMQLAAQFLRDCQTHGYQGLICGGKDAGGSFSTWNWITDNSYAYWAMLAAHNWALEEGDTVFAEQCRQMATEILNGINSYFKHSSEVWWWQVVESDGAQTNIDNIVDWLNYAPQFLDLPANGVGDPALGEWIHQTFQEPSGNGGCLWGDRYPNEEYPGMSFQAAFCWLDLGQTDYANAAINWAETSSLWQLVPDWHGILGGWVDWLDVTNPYRRAGGEW
ncbi:hypothetical protein ACFL1E_04325, partial [Candidatus Omnitrophota bacterium]